MHTDQLSRIRDFLAQRRLALVGASASRRRFGNTVLKELRSKGYQIFPVHRTAPEIDGAPCSPSLAALPEQVGGLILVVPPSESLKLLRQAQQLGILKVWMQQGAECPEATEFCRQHGMSAVTEECILMFAEPASFVHRMHRWFRSLFSRSGEVRQR